MGKIRHFEGGPDQIYDMGKQVGEGSFGFVCKATHKQTGQIHAIKAVPKAKVKAEELWAEMGIMAQLDHPHIMRLYHTFENEKTIFMASELCEGGEFFQTIEQAGYLHESAAAVVIKQVLGAVSYLHSKTICHRDVKPENFLVSKKLENEGDHGKLQLKLIDFGTAKDFGKNVMDTKVCTPHYVAPEVLKKNELVYTEKVDVWSCGVVLYMTLCGFMPFHHVQEFELLKMVKKGKYEFKPRRVWELISEAAKTLIRRMMCVKASDRCSALEAYNHEWFKQEEQQGGPNRAHIDEEGMMKQMRKFLGMNKLKQMALQIIARNLCDTKIERLRHIFTSIDADNSGTLTVEELDKVLVGLDVEEAERNRMKDVLRRLDHDESGDIAYTEFIAATLTADQYLKEDLCKAAFLLLDNDQDGHISAGDIAVFLAEEGKASTFGINQKSINAIMKIMREVDTNDNGEIGWEEFMELMSEDEPMETEAAARLWHKRHKAKEKSFVVHLNPPTDEVPEVVQQVLNASASDRDLKKDVQGDGDEQAI